MACEHEYKILHDGIEVEETRFVGEEEVSIELSGCVIFYCEKCLDIQKKVL